MEEFRATPSAQLTLAQVCTHSTYHRSEYTNTYIYYTEQVKMSSLCKNILRDTTPET